MNRLNRGFSTLELTLVVSVAGVTAAIAIPRVNSSIQRTKLERTASLLAADISRVRENARSYGLEQTISFSGNSYTISTVTATGTTSRTVDLNREPVESNVQVTRTSGVNLVRFNAYGVPDQEFVIGLSKEGVWRIVTVSAGSGDVDVVTTLPTRFSSDSRNAAIGPVAQTAVVAEGEEVAEDASATESASASAKTTATAMTSESTETSTDKGKKK